MLMLRRTATVATAGLLAVLVVLSTSGSSSGTSPARSVPSGPAGPFGEQRPNVVVIMADDMREDDLRFMPNVRRLIGGEGVHFENMFSPHPLCCPARASFLTGQYTHNHEVWSHTDPYGFQALRDEQTLPVWLNEVGYNTVFLGKYLNGYGRQRLLDGSPSMHYVPPGWTDWRGSIEYGGDGQYGGGTYRYFDTTLNVNGLLEPHQGRYNTRLFGDQSRQIIKQYAASPKPFFFYASYVAPHNGQPVERDDPKPTLDDAGGVANFPTPARPRGVRGDFDDVVTEAPGAAGEDDVSDKPFFIRGLPALNRKERNRLAEVTRQRAESLSVLDAEVEQTIDVLEQTGELDNTIVAFTSDNGYLLGEHRQAQGKILPYEPSLRVPLMVRGPGIPAGETRQDPFTMIDFAPSILTAAGARAQPTVDGVSLLDVARDGDQGWSRGVFTETGPRSVRTGVEESANFLVRATGPSPLRFSQGVRAPGYLYVEHASRERELYDLRADPDQLTNLVRRRSERVVVRQLAAMLDRLRHCSGSTCALPLPETLQSH